MWHQRYLLDPLYAPREVIPSSLPFRPLGGPNVVSDLFFTESQVNGTIAPAYGAGANRIPFKQGAGEPFFAHVPGRSSAESPVTNTYIQIENANHLAQVDFEQSRAASRPTYMRDRSFPVWHLFTPELNVVANGNERLSTGFVNWSYLPLNPTDSDYNDAGVLAKSVPPVPALFTPDANFISAPGVSWRYVDV